MGGSAAVSMKMNAPPEPDLAASPKAAGDDRLERADSLLAAIEKQRGPLPLDALNAVVQSVEGIRSGHDRSLAGTASSNCGHAVSWTCSSWRATRRPAPTGGFGCWGSSHRIRVCCSTVRAPRRARIGTRRRRNGCGRHSSFTRRMRSTRGQPRSWTISSSANVRGNGTRASLCSEARRRRSWRPCCARYAFAITFRWTCTSRCTARFVRRCSTHPAACTGSGRR